MANYGSMRHQHDSEAVRFDAYLELLAERCGHADRREPLRAYVTGLMLPGDRKSIEPMAARIDPRRVRARHQAMHHLVANAPWDDRALLATIRDYALTGLERHGSIAAWIVDDTGFPKKGKHSVGVARQYCGLLGKQDNCQVAVTVSLANRAMSIPAAYRLYLPEEWVKDAERRKAAGVPPEIVFQPKWRIALNEIRELVMDDVPRAPVVADAGYGDTTAFRDGIAELGLSYAVAVKGGTTVWLKGNTPLPPARWKGTGRPPTLLRRDAEHQPVTIEAAARSLPKSAWKSVRWREGTKGSMRSRFARMRVTPAHRDYWRSETRPEEWLVFEWPMDAAAPTKFWLSNAPPSAPFDELIQLITLRWRIERDYQELKSEFGLDHYEGRGWRGFHHHGVLSIAAYAFLAAERARLSPPQPLAFLKAAPIPKGFRPRGSPVAPGAA